MCARERGQNVFFNTKKSKRVHINVKKTVEIQCVLSTLIRFFDTGFCRAGSCLVLLLWQGRVAQRFNARQAVVINCVPKLDFVRNFYQISGCLSGSS